jgi:hypothetical protein
MSAEEIKKVQEQLQRMQPAKAEREIAPQNKVVQIKIKEDGSPDLVRTPGTSVIEMLGLISWAQLTIQSDQFKATVSQNHLQVMEAIKLVTKAIVEVLEQKEEEDAMKEVERLYKILDDISFEVPDQFKNPEDVHQSLPEAIKEWARSLKESE